MKDEKKTKKQLIDELTKIRKRVVKLEKVGTRPKQTEEALREKTMMLDNTLRSASEIAIATTDLDFRITYYNPKAEELFGYTSAEVVGKTVMEMHTKEKVDPERFEDAIEIVRREGQYYYTVTLQTEEGAQYLESRVAGISDTEGELVGFSLFSRDVTKRTKAEEAVKMSKEMLKLIINNIPQAVFWKDRESRFLGCNEALANIIGIANPEDIVGKTDYDISVTKEEADAYREDDRSVMNSDTAKRNILEKLHNADGSMLWLNTNKVPLHDNERKVIGILGTFEDITERKQSEQAVKESEKKYRLLAENTVDFIFQMDLKLKFIYMSPSLYKVMGYYPEEVIGSRLFKYTSRKEFITMARVAITTLKNYKKNPFALFEAKLFNKKGEEVPVEISGRVILNEKGRPIGLQGNIRDITKRKKAEEEIRFLSSVVEQSVDGMAIADINGKLLFANEAWVNMHGYENAMELLGQNLSIFHNKEQLKNDVLPFNRKVIERGHYIGEVGHARKDGTIFPTQMTTTLLRDENDKPIAMAAAATDITKRKLAEEALQESEEKYRTIVSSMSDMIFLLDEKDLFVNLHCHPGSPLFLSPEKIIGKRLQDMMPPNVSELYDETAGKVRKTGNTHSYEYSLQIEDREMWFLATIDQHKDEKCLIAAIKDITERKLAEEEKAQIEEQYQQAQKVESIGRLAGGIAHDLNNLLSPIIIYGEMLVGGFGPDDSRKRKVEQIIQAGLRARDLVRQLLAFSRKQTLEYKPVDMSKAVSGFEKLLRRAIREDIEIRIIPSSDVHTVMADIGQIEQVIMNMAVNAQDAMPEGGKLTIETAPVSLDEDYAATHLDAEPGRYVMLAVSDTGCGMDDETRERLFEPFFSTKGDQGTGLGLATVYGIVKQHNGSIWVYSELDKGTTFKVYLPVSGVAHVEDKTDKETTTSLKGSETILLVEDNEHVRYAAWDILEQQGYSVIVAENGPEALKILESRGDTVHLLLTDVVMPEMNGKELYIKAAEKHPGLKVIYMSGYTENVIAHHGVLEEGVAFIQKPLTIETVTAKVRDVLKQD